MPMLPWDTHHTQMVLAIDCTESTLSVALTNGHPSSPQSAHIIWHIQSSIQDWGILLQRANNSLAQVQRIDAITHTIHTGSNAIGWQFGLQLCALLPLPLMIHHALSYVVCINDAHIDTLAIEAYFRKQALVWAYQRMRVNCIRQKSTPTTQNSTAISFLMGNESRVLTGALFQDDGQMLMGGHPIAERIITQQCMLHHIDES